jgi:hypothetical protein
MTKQDDVRSTVAHSNMKIRNTRIDVTRPELSPADGALCSRANPTG